MPNQLVTLSVLSNWQKKAFQTIEKKTELKLQISMNCDMTCLQKRMCLEIDCLQLFHSLECAPLYNLLSPIGNRLQMEGLKFREWFILNSSAPNPIVELTRYKCKRDSKTNLSSCKYANLVCNIQICVNVKLMKWRLREHKPLQIIRK